MDIARQFLLGRYASGDSLIHKLDPRVKIFYLALISISLFYINRIESLLYPLGLLIPAIIISRIKLSRFLKGIAPILWLAGFAFILHALIPDGRTGYALVISLRLVLLFLWATVLTVTTPSEELGKAISWYAYPLKIFKISPENIALTFSMALKFFPMVIEEADSIIREQKLEKRKLKLRQRLELFCTTLLVRLLEKARSMGTTPEKSDKIKFGKTGLREIVTLAIAGAYIFLIYRSSI